MNIALKVLKSFRVEMIRHGQHYYLDPQLVGKIAKRHFFQDIQNSFQWATGIGLEPHQNFFRKKIPTNTVARAVQSFGQNGPFDDISYKV